MFCSSCGKELRLGDRFCGVCGAEVFVGVSPVKEAEESNQAASAQLPRIPQPTRAALATPPSALLGSHPLYAGFWRRTAASIIDGVIVFSIVLAAAFVVLTAGVVRDEYAEPFGSFAGILVAWLYFAIFESSSAQATLGKRALGIKVVSLSGKRIGFGRATGRHFAKILSHLSLFIGYLMAGWTRRRRALHDIVAGCLVIARSATSEDVQDDGAGRSTGRTMPMSTGTIVAVATLPAIGIIGILAAIALPAYQDYVARAKMSEVLAALNSARAQVHSYYTSTGRIPRNLAETGISTAASNHIAKMDVSPEGAVVFAVVGNIDPSVDGRAVYLVPSQAPDKSIKWDCYIDDGMAMKYVPASCRNKIGKLN